MLSYKWFVSIILLLSSITSCVASEKMSENENEKLFELPQNCNFREIGNNDNLSYECSPRLADELFSEFTGLLINGPRVVEWPKNVSLDDYVVDPSGNSNSPLRFMIAGLSSVPDSTLGLDGDVAYEVLVVAVNQNTAETYSGKMMFVGIPGPKPSDIPGVMPLDDALEQSDTIRQSHFNIDLVQNLEIPITDATYTVYATLGEYKSNVLTIKTTVK